MIITMVTGNCHKVDEAVSFFSDVARIEHVSMDLPEIRHEDVRCVAYEKARAAWERLHRPVIVDDTGFFINALNGFPGTCAAYCMKTIGNAGILRLMEGVKDRSAYFQTVIAYATDDGIRVFSGRIDGLVLEMPVGTGGFGYDPIFSFEGRSLAEIPLSEKSVVSHRGRALAGFRDWFISKKPSEYNND
ncbi:MAG: RdgB/HAM1 family non-canonical purine NTP pyrophosphatase [Methanocalculus sp.]|nr:RdgB/HAM1 family non-canonical purine NTP pyrophosphatase [Methanocalculus sp.]MDO8840718.1 RdgB/HAM1 family non-canonical purine NTP pyrophosphatase [Methanocalculus sp.]